MLNDVERITLLGIKQPFLRIMVTWSSEDLGTGCRHRAAAETVSRFTGPTNHGKESSKKWRCDILMCCQYTLSCVRVYIYVCVAKSLVTVREIWHMLNDSTKVVWKRINSEQLHVFQVAFQWKRTVSRDFWMPHGRCGIGAQSTLHFSWLHIYHILHGWIYIYI